MQPVGCADDNEYINMLNLTQKEQEIGRWLVGEGLVKKHYHSAELFQTKEDTLYPIYRQGDEMLFIGPDDSKTRFSYSRVNGSPVLGETFNPGSCDKGYLINVPLRIVVFNDYEKENRQHLITRILGVSFLQNVKFVKYTAEAIALGKEESPIGDFAFGGKTFYLAIDLTVRVTLQRDDCTEDNCFTIANPIC